MPTNIRVLDSVTYVGISGATVYLNGIGQGQTNSSGNITLATKSGGSFTVSVNASGYNRYTNTVADGIPFTAFIVSSVVPTSTSFVLTVYPEAPAIGKSFSFSNSGNPVSIEYEAGGLTLSDLTPGPQTVTANLTGYDPISQEFDTTTQTHGTIELVATTDPGLPQGTNPQLTLPLTTNVNTLPALTSPTNAEFVAPNTGQGTYFTMTQARMYIGRVFIDELNGLQFALQDNKIPIYGYASRFFDAIAQGKSLVQGQFTINFISEGYLYTALNDYISHVDTGTDKGTQAQQDSQAQLDSLTSKLQNPDPQWTPAMIANAQADVQNLVANMGPTALNKTKANIATSQKANNNNILGLAGGDYPNAVYRDIGFDIVVQYEGAGRTVIRRLEGCRLISNESIMDHSGTPILDSYGFIARRLR